MANSRNSKGSVRRADRSETSDLAQRIAAAQKDYKGSQNQTGQLGGGDMSGMARAMRLGTEFIAAILVGAGMGYLLDLWLKTGPWLLLVMLLAGFGAGVLNVVRAAADMNAANPAPPGSDLGPEPEDEDDY